MSFLDSVNEVNKKIPGALPDLRIRGMKDFPHISTGCFIVDYITGIGGIPRGRLTELHGLQSSGKTTLALMAAAECQSGGEGVLYIDYEHAVDVKYAERLGVSLEPHLWAIHQPNSAEDGLRIGEMFILNGGCGMVICDSVAAMVPQSEMDGEIGESQIGAQSRLMSVALRQLKGKIERANVAWIFINQLRDVVDLTWAGQQAAKRGRQYTTPGGNALKFYADLRIEFMPTGQERVERESLFGGREKEKVVIGQRARVTAVKNKCAAPFRSAEIFLRHGAGIDSTVPCVELAVRFGIITTKGSGYFKIPQPYCSDSMMEESVHGRESLIAYFESRPDKLNLLFEPVWQALMSSGD